MMPWKPTAPGASSWTLRGRNGAGPKISPPAMLSEPRPATCRAKAGFTPATVLRARQLELRDTVLSIVSTKAPALSGATPKETSWTWINKFSNPSAGTLSAGRPPESEEPTLNSVMNAQRIFARLARQEGRRLSRAFAGGALPAVELPELRNRRQGPSREFQVCRRGLNAASFTAASTPFCGVYTFIRYYLYWCSN